MNTRLLMLKKEGVHVNKIEVSETNKAIGKAIAKRRKIAGLSQEKVAEKLKIGTESVSRIERGIVMPTIERLLELAEMFSCPVSDFLSQISPRSTDRGIYLDSLLASLSEDDQNLLIEMVERFTLRLKA